MGDCYVAYDVVLCEYRCVSTFPILLPFLKISFIISQVFIPYLGIIFFFQRREHLHI